MIKTKEPLKAPALNEFHLDLMGKFNISPTDFSGARLGVIPWMYLLNQEPEEPRNEDGFVHTTITNFMKDSGWHFRICSQDRLATEKEPEVLKSIYTLAYQRYYRQIVMPVRHWLEPEWQKRPKKEKDWEGLHLNLVTAEEEQVVKNTKTGRLSLKKVGPRSLCLIPTSTTVLDTIGQPDERRRLAPLALRQIMTKVGYRTIRTDRDMQRNIDGWLESLETVVAEMYRGMLYRKIQKDAPCIAQSPRIEQLLLPGLPAPRIKSPRSR